MDESEKFRYRDSIRSQSVEDIRRSLRYAVREVCHASAEDLQVVSNDLVLVFERLIERNIISSRVWFEYSFENGENFIEAQFDIDFTNWIDINVYSEIKDSIRKTSRRRINVYSTISATRSPAEARGLSRRIVDR